MSWTKGRDERYRLERHPDGARFRDAAASFLTATEVENNLVVGIATRLAADPDAARAAYLATVALAGAGDVIGAVVRTPPFVAIVTNLPLDAVPVVVEGLATELPELPGIFGPRVVANAFAEHWSDRTGARVEPDVMLPEYVLERVVAQHAPGYARAPAAAEHEQVYEWTRRFVAELGVDGIDGFLGLARQALDADRVALWDDDGPVTMAAAIGDTPTGARMGLVYTPQDKRRRGYASACVAALCQQMLDRGKRFCALNADASNPASNAVYRKVGFRAGEIRQELRFFYAGEG